MKRRGGNKRRIKAARRAWRKRIHLIGWMDQWVRENVEQWQKLGLVVHYDGNPNGRVTVNMESDR